MKLKAIVDRSFGVLSLALGLASGLMAETIAANGARPGALRIEGAAFTSFASLENCELIAGPTANQAGVASIKGARTARGRLTSEIGLRGSVAFWFHLDRAYRSGTGQVAVREKLIEFDDLLSISFAADDTSVSMISVWQDRAIDAQHGVRVLLPELPGPGWHHFALSWDAGTGDINAYIDGSPYYVPSQKAPPWSVKPTREMSARFGRIAIAHIQIDDAPLDAESLRRELGPNYYGKLDRLFGATALPALDVGNLKGKLLWSCLLASAEDTRNWRLEGPGRIGFSDGWMLMDSERPDGPEGHIVYWAPVSLPDRFCAEWEFKFRAEKGLCIVFFAARGESEKDIFDPSLHPRTGVFSEYTKGDIDCYHISYFANAPSTPRIVANLRKNHGFHLLSNGPTGVARPMLGEVHRAVLVKDGPSIRMSVDGQTIIDFRDDAGRAGPPLGAGRFGLRQMQWTSASYRNLRIYRLRD